MENEEDDHPMMDDGTFDDESIDDSTMDSDSDDSDDSDSDDRFISGITWDLFDDVEWPNGFDFYISSFVLCQPETIAALRGSTPRDGKTGRTWRRETSCCLLQELGSLPSLQELDIDGNVNVNDRCQLLRYATNVQELSININAADSLDDVQRVMSSSGDLMSLRKFTVVFSTGRDQQAQIAWVAEFLSQMDNLSSITLFPENYEIPLEISPQTLIGLARLSRGLTKLSVSKVRFQKPWVKAIADIFTEKKNTTLKYLKFSFDPPSGRPDDEYPKNADRHQLLEALRQNYDLEHVKLYRLLTNDAEKKADTICELNRAGRCYLLSIDSSGTRQKGIEVLSKVTHDLDCILTHLLENPVTCLDASVGESCFLC